jgi:hypothetical protein
VVESGVSNTIYRVDVRACGQQKSDVARASAKGCFTERRVFAAPCRVVWRRAAPQQKFDRLGVIRLACRVAQGFVHVSSVVVHILEEGAKGLEVASPFRFTQNRPVAGVGRRHGEDVGDVFG